MRLSQRCVSARLITDRVLWQAIVEVRALEAAAAMQEALRSASFAAVQGVYTFEHPWGAFEVRAN